MKSSEAKPLNAEELKTLKLLFQRWVLCSYPYYGGSSEESNANQTYYDIKRDCEDGEQRYYPKSIEDFKKIKERIEKYGESNL